MFIKNMALRYCFISDNLEWENLATSIFSGLKTQIEKLSPEEGCVTLQDGGSIRDFKMRLKTIANSMGFSKPVYVPKWVSIINNGPYVAEEQFVRVNKEVKKITGETVPISSIGELALNSYDRNNKSSTYHKNFETSFMFHTGLNIKDVDFSSLKPIPFQPPVDKKYGYVNIDSILDVPLKNYTTPYTMVNREGTIVPGIRKRDITLNSKVPVPGFKNIFVPGASWTAKWSTGRTLLYFSSSTTLELEEAEDEDTDEDNSSEDSDISIISYNSAESQYPDTDSEEEEEVVTRNQKGPKFFPYVPDEKIPEPDNPDFVNLTANEKKYLPLSFVISQAVQWKIILNCLSSNFNNIRELPKVSDTTLELIADSISYSISKGNKPLPAAIGILKYAEKRHL